MHWQQAREQFGIEAVHPFPTAGEAFTRGNRGSLCTVSLWGEEWWLHAGVRGVGAYGYVTALRAPRNLAVRLTYVPWADD